MNVELITDRQGFQQLQPVWNELLNRSGIRHPFVTHEWLTVWWDTYRPSGTPYILAVRDGSDFVAAAPLMLSLGKIYGCPVRRLHGMGNVYTERFDFLLGERPRETAQLLWEHLSKHRRRWDVMELRQLCEDGVTLAGLNSTEFGQRCGVAHWDSTNSPYVAVRETWEEYFQALKKTHRDVMRKRLARLEQCGPVRMDCVTTAEHLDRDFEDAVRLESSDWKSREGTAIRSREDSRTYFRRIVERAADKGWLRLYFLAVGDKRVAVHIAVLFQNRLFMLKSGYDPQYSPYSPTHLLCDRIFREAWELRFTEADFLGDSEQWKLSWATDLRQHSWLFCFPHRPLPWSLHKLKFSVVPRLQKSPAYAALKRTAERIGIAASEE